MGAGNLDAARSDFEKVVRLQPSLEQGHSALGTVLLRQGHFPEGIRELEKALALKPGDDAAQLNLAMAYLSENEPAKALPWFSKYESAAQAQHRAVPDSVVEAHVKALADAGRYPDAVAKLRELLARTPGSPELLDAMGSLYAAEHDWPEAEKEFRAAIVQQPDLASAHLHLGVTLAAENNPEARTELGRAYELAPNDAAVAAQWGEALADDGKDDEAIPVLRHAVELAPDDGHAGYALALALQRSGQFGEAIPLLRKAAEATPADAGVLTNLGMALSQAQQAKDALPVLQRAITLDPANIETRQDLAVAYLQLNQFDDAVRELSAAIKLKPDSADLHYNLGFAYKMQDKPALAIPELEQAAKLNPSASEPHYALGVLYREAGRNAEAAAELSTALKLQPQNGDGWETLGSVYNDLGQLDNAANALAQAIAQLPGQYNPHLTLAAVLTKQGKTAEAAAERKQGAELMHASMNRQRAEVATNTAESTLKSGKQADAEAQFREALSYDANYAPAHLGLARALDAEGKPAEAAAERQKATQNAQ